MPSFVIFGLIIWGIVTLVGIFHRWMMGLSALTLILFIAVLVVSDNANTYMLGKRPYYGEVSVIGRAIHRNEPYPYSATNIIHLDVTGTWLTLEIKNTDEREHPVNMAVCSIRGPIYYDYSHQISINGFIAKEVAERGYGTYLGERRMIVRLVAVASTKLAEGWVMTPPVMPVASRWFFWSDPDPSERAIAYFLAFPRLRLFDDDVVEWCKFGKTIADLPQDQLEPRVEWIGDHADIPIDHVALDMDVPLSVIQALSTGQ